MADQYFLPTESLQVSPGAGISPSATPQAFGAGVGQALGVGGDVATRIYHDHNAVAAMAAQNQLQAWSNEALYHPQNGVLHQESGDQAPKLVDKTLADYDSQTSKIAAALPNDDARARFQMQADEHSLAMKRQLYGYEHAQVTQYADKQTAAFIDNSRTAAVQQLSVMGPPSDQQTRDMQQSILDEIAKQKAAVADACNRNGASAEVCQQQQAAVTSATHMAVIEQLYHSGQDGAAKDWLAEHRQDLDAHDLARATSMAKQGSLEDDARHLADGIVLGLHQSATASGDATGVNEETALQKLEDANVTDTAVHDRAQARIVQHFRLAKEAHQEQQQTLLGKAYDAIDDEGNTDHTPPADVLGQLDPHNRRAALSYSEQVRKLGQPQTDPVVMAGVREMAGDPQRWDDFSKADLSPLKASLSPTDFKHALALQAGAADATSKRDAKLSQWVVSAQVQTQLFKDNGIAMPKGPKPGEEASSDYKAAAVMQDSFAKQLNRLVVAESLKLKRELTPPEVTEQAKTLFTQTNWQHAPTNAWQEFRYGGQGGAFDSLLGFKPTIPASLVPETTPLFQTPIADKLAYRIEDIPVDQRKRLIAIDTNAGRKRSDEEMLRAYNDSLWKGYLLREAQKLQGQP